ncbi:hypothetical protein TSUD_138570 [Trifolium subterraneum]|uniref:RNase H type-1 domain-containing protein n=1 Tax=Trifolium subterraneum TaxID=3900 RepID=A0A2Z6MB28_TRISU|nr:hypothetical protein TSUD_138570 [Trifolium subterraneum]
MCNDGAEDDFHVFFTCPQVVDCWTAAGLHDVIYNRLSSFNNVAELLLNICNNEDENIAGRVAMLIWCIWQNRNNTIWNNNSNSALQVGQQAFQAWQQWFDAQKLHNRGVQQPAEQQNVRWVQPPVGWIKCNVDAGFFQAINTTSAANCFRQSNRLFLSAETRCYNSNFTTLEGEGMALLNAVQFAISQGWDYVIFESDSQSLVNAITSNKVGISEFCSLVSSIRNSLSSLSNFEVKFVRRQANMVAHSLARAAISWASHQSFDFVPPCIESLINNELS